MASIPHIAFSEEDYKTLLEVSSQESPYCQMLKEELSRGSVLPRRSVPKTLVTMNSNVLYLDLFTGLVRKVTLVYPTDHDPARGKLSVLSPLGVALIGLSVGQDIYWRKQLGNRVQIRVLKVTNVDEGNPRT